jgi:putative membrane-bound dehydrogenase-like protein
MRTAVIVFALMLAGSKLCAETVWRAGFAKMDVTPTEPVRMSGYGNRDRPSEGIDTPLFVRAVALRHGTDPPHVLVSVDTIGLSGSMVRELTRQLEQEHGVARQRIVISCTHTHTGPHLVSGLSNIFAVELTEAEKAAGRRYTQRLREVIVSAVGQALQSLSPAQLAFGSGKAEFAANRRVVKDGRWTGFGVQPGGAVDHSVPVLRISDEQGKIRGVIFNYACHCTTLEGNYYRINADWAGYAATDIEAAYPDSVALCTIGCGADANPEPRGAREMSEIHGRALAREVKRIAAGEMNPVDKPIDAAFGYAGLSFDLPTIDELRERGQDPTPQVRRHSENFQEVYKRDGRLPATYPVPIQSWQFGDQLTMVFLGGEVVADYALRLKRELPTQPLWVTAYANDVLGYIASERMRAEGGYEYDMSGIYYNLPGPWAAGTEDLLIRRVHELLKHSGPQPPLEPDATLRSISVPDEFKVQLVAAEPLVVDPINLAFGHDGALWVVEMGDYPLGSGGPAGGGRVKRLTDNDGDGVFDEASVFVDGLNFPTGVHPWRDGVIVIAVPEIFFARDTDGDGQSDQRDVLFSGLAQGNPQHLANGFSYGLDHSLHCAAADALGEVRIARSGETVKVSGHDVQIWPDSGKLALVSGRTQYIRSRDDWGDWFGNDNSRPMYHYPIEDRYLARNKSARFSENKQQLFDPPVAPPVFPLSETVDRFNDLYAANRFTSACSAIVVRSGALGEPLNGAALVCEPVHNLVHRAELVEQGSTFRAQRVASEQASEFLRSSDPWFRPVRVTVGPDGMIWVVDMYRAVIEHPEWIPEAWQQQLDLRAGSNRGRIYRVVPKNDAGPARWPDVAGQSTEELIGLLSSTSGTLRDMAQQELLQRGDKSIAGALRRVAAANPSPQARLHALWTLDVMEELQDEELVRALGDLHSGVVRNAIVLAEPRVAKNRRLLAALVALVDHPDAKVRLQLALALGESLDPAAGAALGKMVPQAGDDPWLASAIVSSSTHHSLAVLERFLRQLRADDASTAVASRHVATIADLMATAESAGVNSAPLVAEAIQHADADASWVFALAAACAATFDEDVASDSTLREAVRAVYERARSMVADEAAVPALRCQAISLFGRSLGDAAPEQTLLAEVLTPATPLDVQLAAAERLAAFRDREALELLMSRWPELSHSVRDAIAMQLVTSALGTETLISKLESGEIGVGDLSPSARQSLRQSGSQSWQSRVNRVLGKVTVANEELIQRYLRFQHDASGEPDLVRGRELFQKHCAACHKADQRGRATGPDLSNLTDRSPRALTESILAPNRSLEHRYHGYVVLTLDGRAVTGTIAEEAGDTITLSLADGKQTTIQRHEIDELRNTRMSLMPEGFERELDPPMMRDLIEYLRSESFAQAAVQPQ